MPSSEAPEAWPAAGSAGSQEGEAGEGLTREPRGPCRPGPCPSRRQDPGIRLGPAPTQVHLGACLNGSCPTWVFRAAGEMQGPRLGRHWLGHRPTPSPPPAPRPRGPGSVKQYQRRRRWMLSRRANVTFGMSWNRAKFSFQKTCDPTCRWVFPTPRQSSKTAPGRVLARCRADVQGWGAGGLQTGRGPATPPERPHGPPVASGSAASVRAHAAPCAFHPPTIPSGPQGLPPEMPTEKLTSRVSQPVGHPSLPVGHPLPKHSCLGATRARL